MTASVWKPPSAPVSNGILPNELKNGLKNRRNSSPVPQKRNLIVNDLDFNDLTADDDKDILSVCLPFGNGIPPPPPPPPPPPGMAISSSFHPPAPPLPPAPPSPEPVSRVPFSQLPALRFRDFSNKSPTPSAISSTSSGSPYENGEASGKKKDARTLKLFWKEVKEDKSLNGKKTIWEEIKPVPVDFHKLEYLFENRSKEVSNKKSQEGKKLEILVLEAKRSNAINIGMTKLPHPGVIRNAILKMDTSIINREGIEKVLTMIPTEEEKNLIQEAHLNNPHLPLGSAEGFLQTLSQIPALEQRLRLWAFRLDFDSTEKEMGEQLMDLKMAMEEISKSKTFKKVLATLLSVGNFLNGVEVKGFQLEYLSKVAEVKDTVNKHSLLYHVASFIYEKDPNSLDMYSELGSVCRASRVDFSEVSKSLARLEEECRLSWDRLTIICTTDPTSSFKVRMTDFLHECRDRITVLQVVQRRILNRFKKTLVYLGFPASTAKDMKPNSFLKMLAEFALDYKTMREKVKESLSSSMRRDRQKLAMTSRSVSLNEVCDTISIKSPTPSRQEYDLVQILSYRESYTSTTNYYTTNTSTLNGRSSRLNKLRKNKQLHQSQSSIDL